MSGVMGRKGYPLQCSRLENPMDREAWQATVYRVTESRTQLKRLSTHRVVKEHRLNRKSTGPASGFHSLSHRVSNRNRKAT